MTSHFTSTDRIFLALAIACAVVLSGAASQASGPPPRSSAARRANTADSMLGRDRQMVGRLIVQRSADFGNDLFLNLSIDGRKVANIAWNYRYDALIPAGHHVVTVVAVPWRGSRRPSSTRVVIEPGQTYIFTGIWESDRVVLRRSGGIGNW
jgi:hypothetical protein